MLQAAVIRFVVTEHPSYLTAARQSRDEERRHRLERVAGREVRSVHYLAAGGLRGAEAVVLSGSDAPWKAHDAGELERLGDAVRGYEGPVLGICAGMQLQAMFAGGTVERARLPSASGFGPVEVLDRGGLLRSLPHEALVYKQHEDEVRALPEGFEILARSRECAVEAIAAPDRRWWGTQFHPEEFDAAYPDGEAILRSFFELALGGAADAGHP